MANCGLDRSGNDEPDDDFPPVEELLRVALRKEASQQKHQTINILSGTSMSCLSKRVATRLSITLSWLVTGVIVKVGLLAGDRYD